MDEKELQKQITEYMAKLPKEVQDILTQAKWVDEVQKIGTKYELREDQMKMLIVEVMLGLLGVIHPDQFNTQLEQKIVMPPSRINDLVGDLDQAIFRPVRDEIINAHAKNLQDADQEEFRKTEAEDIAKTQTVIQHPETIIAPPPIAPAAQAPDQTLGSRDKLMLETTGIEVMDTQPTVEPTSTMAFAEFKNPNTETDLQKQKDLLSQLENPVRVAPKVLNEVGFEKPRPASDAIQFSRFAAPQANGAPAGTMPPIASAPMPQTPANPLPTPPQAPIQQPIAQPAQAPVQPVAPSSAPTPQPAPIQQTENAKPATPTYTPHTFSIYQNTPVQPVAPVQKPVAPQPIQQPIAQPAQAPVQPVVVTPVAPTPQPTPVQQPAPIQEAPREPMVKTAAPPIDLPIATAPVAPIQAQVPVTQPITQATPSAPAPGGSIDKTPPKINIDPPARVNGEDPYREQV